MSSQRTSLNKVSFSFYEKKILVSDHRPGFFSSLKRLPLLVDEYGSVWEAQRLEYFMRLFR
jgi:hypothetical protein